MVSPALQGNNSISDLAQLQNRLAQLEIRAAGLENENRDLRKLYDTSPLPYQSLNENGCVIEVNMAWLTTLGYSRQEVIGRNFSEFLHPERIDHFQKNFSRLKAVGEISEVEFELRKKNGSFILVAFYAQTGRDGQDRFQQTYCLFQDTTKFKRDETERKILQDQLIQSQKMESVGRLVGGVAHDFNNMLGVILGHAEMMEDKINLSPASHMQLEEIRKAAKRSAKLTGQLLAFARKQTADPKVVDLNEDVAGMLKMLQRLIGEDIDLIWQPDSGLWPVKMDPSQLDQVLANLCVNARDAIPGVGKISIGSQNCIFDVAYCAMHQGYKTGEYVLLTVSDNGCGMDENVKAHLFEPFFTTKELGKGTGLGLATVYGIVKQNNGFINVYTEPGQGTTVKIYLPRHTTGTARAEEIGPTKDVAGGHETILLVEDELSILSMITTMLERLGYRVLQAQTPREAFRLVNSFKGSISLLLSDVIMPEMNGRDLAVQMKSLCPDLKVLFMSGYTANVIAQHGVLERDVEFLEKPFAKKKLAEKIRNMLDAGA